MQLEEIPRLQGNYADEQTIAANEATQIAGLAGVNVGLNKQIDALGAEITAGNAACVADKNLLKAKSRKNTLKHLLLGGAIVEGIKLYFFHTF